VLSQEDLQTLRGLTSALRTPAEEEKDSEVVNLKQAEAILCFKATHVKEDPPELVIRHGDSVYSVPLLKDYSERIFVRLQSGVWYGNKVFDVFLT
jgi:hypothetical protein